MNTNNNIRPCSYDPSNDLVPMTDSFGNVRQYLPVERRLHWFLTYCEENRIPNRILEDNVHMLTDSLGVATVIIQMYDRDATCAKAGFSVTRTQEDSNIIQRAITSAKGRALANLGFGSAYSSNDEGGDVICDSGAPAKMDRTAPAAPIEEAKSQNVRSAPAPKEKSVERPVEQVEQRAAAPRPSVTAPVKAEVAPKPPVQAAPKAAPSPQPTMTLEEAQNYVLDNGIYKGRTMGELVGINKSVVEHYAYRFNKSKAPQLTLAAEIVLKACEEDI